MISLLLVRVMVAVMVLLGAAVPDASPAPANVRSAPSAVAAVVPTRQMVPKTTQPQPCRNITRPRHMLPRSVWDRGVTYSGRLDVVRTAAEVACLGTGLDYIINGQGAAAYTYLSQLAAALPKRAKVRPVLLMSGEAPPAGSCSAANYKPYGNNYTGTGGWVDRLLPLMRRDQRIGDLILDDVSQDLANPTCRKRALSIINQAAAMLAPLGRHVVCVMYPQHVMTTWKLVRTACPRIILGFNRLNGTAHQVRTLLAQLDTAFSSGWVEVAIYWGPRGRQTQRSYRALEQEMAVAKYANAHRQHSGSRGLKFCGVVAFKHLLLHHSTT